MTWGAPSVAAVLASLAFAACSRPADRLVVAAASDLTHALPELAAAFQLETGVEVVPTLGASRLLASQIVAGAPFDVFMSANVAFVDEVVGLGRCDAATRAVYGHGHLVMWVRDGAPPASVGALADPRWVRVAIANPETAPYGLAARQALETAGVRASLEPRLVRGENVRQALQLAESGNAEVAIVASALVIGGPGHWRPVPTELHPPILQALAVCGPVGSDGRSGRASARAFVRFVLGPEGQAILHRWGLGSGGGS